MTFTTRVINLAFLAVAAHGCTPAEFAALAGPAASVIGALESDVRAQAQKDGTPLTDPKIVKMLETARKLDQANAKRMEKLAAEDRARDKEILEALKLATRPCPATPVAPAPTPLIPMDCSNPRSGCRPVEVRPAVAPAPAQDGGAP